MNKDRLSSPLHWLEVVPNTLYKLILAALLWIGYGLQNIAIAISSGGHSCIVDSDAIDREQGRSTCKFAS